MMDDTLGIGVCTYSEADKQRIYAFLNGTDGRLSVHYQDGSRWNWADRGTPLGTTVSSTPGVIAFLEVGKPRIYAFVQGADGHLHVNYWDDSRWKWADHGTPHDTTVSSAPGVVTYLGAGKQRIYAFVQSANGHLHVNYWDGSQWMWADQGTPPGTTVASAPGVVTYYSTNSGTRRIYVFVPGADGHLYVYYWNGAQWKWVDQGTPGGATAARAPAVVTYGDSIEDRIYAFVHSALTHDLHMNYWNGSQWKWADQGPHLTPVQYSAPGAITYLHVKGLEYGEQRIYVFITLWGLGEESSDTEHELLEWIKMAVDRSRLLSRVTAEQARRCYISRGR